MDTSPRRGRSRRIPFIAGLTAFLVAAGTTAGWAFWTAQTSAAGSVTTSAVAVSQVGFDTPAATKYTPSSLVSTRSFTVTNGGAVAGTATVTMGTAQTYAANFGVQVWAVANVAACTAATPVPGTGVTTGTWASTSFSPTLAAGASAVYCVRTTIADWRALAEASGGQTVNPVLSVSLNAAGWVASAPTATHAQTTAGMYPLIVGDFFDPTLASSWHTVRNLNDSGLCLDVSGGGASGPGTVVITWSCHDGANQRWQFIPVSGGNQSLVTIRPRNAPTLRVTTAAAGGLTVQTAASDVNQQWYVQRSTGGTPFYQLVSASTGKCLPMTSASGGAQLTTVDCDDASARLSFLREPLTVTTSSNWFGTTTNVTVSITTLAGQNLTVQRQNTNGTWSTIATIAGASSSVTFAHTNLTNNANNTLRIVFGTDTSAGADLAYGAFVLNRTGTTVTVVSGVG